MPEITRFYGVVIQMFAGDHPPPHFHARYSGSKAMISIRTLALIEGRLPARALGLTIEWAQLHQEELMDLWRRIEAREELYQLPPLP